LYFAQGNGTVVCRGKVVDGKGADCILLFDGKSFTLEQIASRVTNVQHDRDPGRLHRQPQIIYTLVELPPKNLVLCAEALSAMHGDTVAPETVDKHVGRDESKSPFDALPIRPVVQKAKSSLVRIGPVLQCSVYV
jgi:hypothetical protein